MPDDDDGPQIISVQASSGSTVHFTNGTDRAQIWTFESGPFGVVECTLPPGGVVRFAPGSQIPVITLKDAEVDIAGMDNVTRLNEPD